MTDASSGTAPEPSGRVTDDAAQVASVRVRETPEQAVSDVAEVVPKGLGVLNFVTRENTHSA